MNRKKIPYPTSAQVVDFKLGKGDVTPRPNGAVTNERAKLFQTA